MAKTITPPPIDVHHHAPTPRVIRTAQDAARSYDHCVEAYWRGDEDGCAFRDVFARYWQPVVACLEGPPEAESPLGAGGRGLLWRQVDGIIVGEVRGNGCGYQIPVGATLPEADPLHPAKQTGSPSTPLCCL